jgi:hypothetical protein
MKSLNEILAEVQAVDTTSLDAAVAALAQVATDLQAQIDAQSAAADPIVSVTTTTESGVTATFVPQAA